VLVTSSLCFYPFFFNNKNNNNKRKQKSNVFAVLFLYAIYLIRNGIENNNDGNDCWNNTVLSMIIQERKSCQPIFVPYPIK
jgi:hypothetical protein